MGVPKFFMYMSERYPCLSELAREQCIPDFDNLYLDMNGIIHNCSHPDDSNLHFSLSEEDMFKDIFNYIDKLFFLIKPQKMFFLAVDGVAPRAKMNQQRSRRFRSAKEAEVLEEKAKQKGIVREDERFDSNCITPGTVFMERLQIALRYFIKNKLSNDPMWQKCRIILSGHETPGEGEHKIMDYIRYMKSQPDYNPNTRHCLYGLDADLIILGLCTHELHFVVLREEVKFGKKTKHVSVEETRFFLLHLGLFREYLELEFDELRQKSTTFDIAQLIDDWVLMSFLVGNDFVPHLPCLHISSNALPLLYKTYIQVYPTLGGNINENGKLNLERLEKFFAALTDVEYDIFKENHADLVYFDMKCSKNGVQEAFDFDVAEINNTNTNDDLAELIENSRQMMDDNEDEDLSDEETHLEQEFATYKRDYYRCKMNKDNSLREVRREQAICYITALQWILDYYYRGVQSWNWYYPYHYAPFISDLKDFKDFKIKFELGKPFLPFEQLLAVLPAASKKLLPAAYHDLMTSEHSDIIQFYPENFETDLNGKKQEWEAVVLIPFIDEVLLLKAMKACEKHLTESEVNRNKHGPMLQYDHTEEDQGPSDGVLTMKKLFHVFCTEKKIWARDIAIPNGKTMCVELSNASRTVFFPGFPTMKHLKFNFELKNSRVRVFDRPSRNNTMVLIPELRTGYDQLDHVASKLLGQVVYIGWPHLVKAKVVAVSNAEKIVETTGVKDYDNKSHNLLKHTSEEHLTNRMGIEMQDFSVLVHVQIYTGSVLSFNSKGRVTTVDSWSPTQTAVPANIVVSEITVHKEAKEKLKKVDDVLKPDTRVFFLGNPFYGSEGQILDTKLVHECGRVQINIMSLPEPNLSEAKRFNRQLESVYVNSYQAACQMGIGNKCVARITGSVLVIPGVRRKMQPGNISKTNIGLQLKFPSFQEERIGYTRRVNQNWMYSAKTIDLILDYYDKFPEVFDALSRCSDDNFFESDIFPDTVGESRLEEICVWLKAQDHLKASVVSCGSKTIEREAAEKVYEAVEEYKKQPIRTLKLQVKPHLLLIPNMTHPEAYKSKSPVRLFDRVVVVKNTYMVPLGSKGTVVGIYPVSDPNPVRLECVRAVDYFYDVLFDKDMPNGHDINGVADNRVVKVPEASLLLVYTPKESSTAENGNTADRHSPQKSQYDNWRQPAPGPSPRQNNNNNNANNQQRNNETAERQRPPSHVDNEQPSTSKGAAYDPTTITTMSIQTTMNGGNLKSIIFQSSNTMYTPSNNSGQPPPAAVMPPSVPQFKRPNGGSHDDFWTPNVGTVRKHAQPFGQQQQPIQQHRPQEPMQYQQQQQCSMPMPPTPQFMPQQTQGFGMRPSERAQDETTVLKSLLGLSMQDNANNWRSPNSTNAGEREVQLPQPPQCWRSDAQRSNMRNHNNPNSVPRPGPMALLARPMGPPPAPLIKYGLIDGQLMPLQGHPQMAPTQQMPMRPPVPQQPPQPSASSREQNFNADSLFKKGAFIPLQAMRQSSSQPNRATGRRKDMVPPNQQQQQQQQRKPQQQRQTQGEMALPTQNLNENVAPKEGSQMPKHTQNHENQQPGGKRQGRPSKIGARFDNMPSS